VKVHREKASDNMADVVGFHHLSLSVSDLGRSTEWYQQVLGLEVTTPEFEGTGFRRTRLGAPGGGLTLTLTRHDQQSGAPFDERRIGMDHVAFRVGDVDVMEALEDRFRQLGVTCSGIRTSGTTAAITLRDPDNIQVEVFGEQSEKAA
jgi:glyoxylase I family protein